MKYVIFKYRQLIMPVIVPDHVTHSQITIEGATPISAGFVKMGVLGLPIAFGKSESLNLSSRPEDTDYLCSVMVNSGASSFLSID